MSKFLKFKRILSIFLVLIIVFSFSSSANDHNSDIAPLALPSITNYFYSTYESTADYYNNTFKDYFYYFDGYNFYYYPYYYDDGLQLRSNCYGYATRMFYELNYFPYENILFEYTEGNSDVTSVFAVYKQQPGEFADKTNGLFLCNLQGHMTHTLYSRTDLNNFLSNLFVNTQSSLYNSNISTKFNYIEQLVEADFAELGYTITEYTGSTIPSASLVSGKRMIALVVGATDFHFYMQHSDNTWSHKGGYGPTSNVCIDCENNALTNNNIRSHALEGAYSGGVLKFYYITKNAIIDSSHADGTFTFAEYGLECVKTIVYPIEAGNEMHSCKDLFNVPINSTRYNLDYIGDTDFFFFTVPSGSGGTYTITLSSVDGPRSFKISLYNSLTALIDTRIITLTEDSPSYSYNYNLTNGSYYYLKIEGNEDETLQKHICNRRYDISIIK